MQPSQPISSRLADDLSDFRKRCASTAKSDIQNVFDPQVAKSQPRRADSTMFAVHPDRYHAQSQPWIDGFALQCQHGKDALVDTAERLALNEAVESFEPKSKLAGGE